MKGKLWLFCGLAVFLLACSRQPHFIHHPRPELAIDFEVFETAGCPTDQYGNRRCGDDSPLAALGCHRIRQPSSLLGALEPGYPLAICTVEPDRLSEDIGTAIDQIEAEGAYFYRSGGLMPVYTRYVIFREGGFELVKTEDEFRTIFAPVETAEEALSYALAVRKLSAYYDLQPQPGFRYLAGEIEDTHVETTGDNFLVHLYRYQAFGCGPHTTSVVEVRVTTQGQVEQVNVQPVFEDPEEDDLCVD